MNGKIYGNYAFCLSTHHFAHAALTCQGHNNPPTEHPFDTVGVVFPFQYFLLHTLFNFEYL